MNKSHRGRKIPILSFFTGAGLLDIGFLQSKLFNVVWHNEFCERFADSFEFGMTHFLGHPTKIENRMSIVSVGPNQILREAFGSHKKPEVFGVIGGPPCPDFSVGGKNLGSKGDNGILSQIYVERILELKPTFFLFENVPGLIRTSKHRAFLAQLAKRLSEHYVLDINVLNALDYGVPQDRQRLFMVGLSKKWIRRNSSGPMKDVCSNEILAKYQEFENILPPYHWFPWDISRRYRNAKKTFSWPGQSKFGADSKKPSNVPVELTVEALLCDQLSLSKMPNGIEGFVPRSSKFKWIPEGDVSKKCFKRLHRWRYSPAAAYGHNEVHLHPTLPRRLTVREAMRIQSIPDSYVFPPEIPLTHKFKTIGNGVPVKLAQAVAEGFRAIFEGRR